MIQLAETKAAPANASVATENAMAQKEQEQPPVSQFSELEIAAQCGDLQKIQELIESGKAKATDLGNENITALHWAALNNQLLVCRYLIDNGADVNVCGGALNGPPLIWAAWRGHVYVVHLLMMHGADINLPDFRGRTAIFFAIESKNTFMLSYLLNHGVDIEAKTENNATPLIMSAFMNADAITAILLRWKANLNAQDDEGQTPLYYAIKYGNKPAIRRFLEDGAEFSIRTKDGRSFREIATENGKLSVLDIALKEADRDKNGNKIPSIWSNENTRERIVAILPYIVIIFSFNELRIFPWYAGVPIALFLFGAMYKYVQMKVYKGKTHKMLKSLYLPGIFTCTLVLVFAIWITDVLWETMSMGYFFSNLIFGVLASIVGVSFFIAVTADPGYIPILSREESRILVDMLASEGLLNHRNFCTTCQIRKPIRSKHCKSCDRCVAKFDHHCPWTGKCIGVYNHPAFVMFVVALVPGILLFDYLAYVYVSERSSSYENISGDPCVLPETVCAWFQYNPYLTYLSLWILMQTTWTIFLAGFQLWQIARNCTTNEMANFNRYGYMSEDVSGGVDGVVTLPQTGSSRVQQHQGHHGSNQAGSVLSLLGLDRINAANLQAAQQASKGNSFDRGVFSNCTNFWMHQGRWTMSLCGRRVGLRRAGHDGAEYLSMYEPPPARQSRSRRRGDGYEAVALEEV